VTGYVVNASVAVKWPLAPAVQRQYPAVTADRRFYDVVRKHPYLSDRTMHVENLRN
jgi:hypothetical protein